jgi:competence protein ComGF
VSRLNTILFKLKRKYAEWRNERAFTLIEALLALSIFTTIVFFVMPMLQVLLHNIDSTSSVQQFEWDVFCSQVKKEVRMSSRVEVISGRLYLTKEPDTIVYEKYGSNIRRRVNSTGHEIILQNAAEVDFTLLTNAVKIKVKDLWGKDYSFTAFSLIKGN